MELTTLPVGAFDENCSVAEAGGRVWIVDPGAEAERIAACVGGRPLGGVLLTHAHFDHIGAIPALQARWPGLPVYVHERDAPVLAHPMNQFPPDYPATPLPRNLRTFPAAAGEVPFEVIETPGHTPGGVCYYDKEEGVLFSGDTLFAGSAGRTDFPGGSYPALMASLQKLAGLPPATRVIPGHGPETTMARETAANPFLQPRQQLA